MRVIVDLKAKTVTLEGVKQVSSCWRCPFLRTHARDVYSCGRPPRDGSIPHITSDNYQGMPPENCGLKEEAAKVVMTTHAANYSSVLDAAKDILKSQDVITISSTVVPAEYKAK